MDEETKLRRAILQARLRMLLPRCKDNPMLQIESNRLACKIARLG